MVEKTLPNQHTIIVWVASPSDMPFNPNMCENFFDLMKYHHWVANIGWEISFRMSNSVFFVSLRYFRGNKCVPIRSNVLDCHLSWRLRHSESAVMLTLIEFSSFFLHFFSKNAAPVERGNWLDDDGYRRTKPRQNIEGPSCQAVANCVYTQRFLKNLQFDTNAVEFYAFGTRLIIRFDKFTRLRLYLFNINRVCRIKDVRILNYSSCRTIAR